MQDTTLNMMVYRLFMMAAICFAAYISMSNANCNLKIQTCAVSCQPNSQARIDCETKCGAKLTDPAITPDGKMCIGNCLREFVNDCMGDCTENCNDEPWIWENLSTPKQWTKFKHRLLFTISQC